MEVLVIVVQVGQRGLLQEEKGNMDHRHTSTGMCSSDSALSPHTIIYYRCY